MADRAIEVQNVTKIYRLYRSPKDRLRELVSLSGKRYHHEFHALRDVSCVIEKGETVGIIGQNGSGKSTLLKIICGVLGPTKGNVKVNGRISSLLELGAGFHPQFTGRENVYMNGALLGLTREEIDKRFPEIEAFAEIGEFMEQPVRTYSSGMYVRLAFACAVNVEPDIVLVDEALAVGDARFQLKCFLKLQELQNRRKTILFVSHDLNTIKKYCSEAIVLDKAQLVFRGDPNEAVNRYSMILCGEDTRYTDQSNTTPSHGAEFRYGSDGGAIVQMAICDISGEKRSLFTSGEDVNIMFQAIAKRDVETPVFAMTIKDAKGQDVYVTNTLLKEVTVPALAQGTKTEVKFSQRMSLIPGRYFVSVGFVEVDKGAIVPLDRRYDAMEIKVIPKGRDSSAGIANLDSSISVSRITEPHN